MFKLKCIDVSKFKFKKKYIKNTQYGKMIISSHKNEIFDEDCVFIFSPGGYNTYSFNMSTNINKPFLAIIELGGDNFYKNDNIGQLFSANFGCIFHYDKLGNNYYKGNDLAFSANFGMLLSIDEGGEDVYLTGNKSLGAGTFGIALVFNAGGNNLYSSTVYSQGFGGTLGFGLLASLKAGNNNNNVYFAGGKYKHAPLVPDDYLSMSQGFGFGIRPDLAGGIGIIFDETGNDFYNGGVYCQGSAYYYSLGILIDLEGNDSYNAVYYPQGSGIHLAAGFLYDEQGDDVYYSRFGPGQGAGHDYGVGFLIDKSGNDCYSIDGGNGFAINNSVGIFIDSSGDDRYERKRYEAYGFGGISRGAGSIGVFLDLGGDDKYSNDYQDNDLFWSNGHYGVGIDISNNEVTNFDEIFINDSFDEIDYDTSIEKLFQMASEWEVGDAINRVKIAREKLMDREEEAIEYILKNKIKTKSGLELRTLVFMMSNSQLFYDNIPSLLINSNLRAITNTIYLIGELKLVEFLPSLIEMVNNNLFVNSILSTLGKFENEDSINTLEKFIDSENVYQRVIVARSLAEINSERSNELLFMLKDDECFLIKSMIELKK
jgi:hypothetical protein